MALAEAARFYTMIEGSLARDRLALKGIESVLFDTEMNWGGLDGVVPVRLMVDEDDVTAARRCLCDRDGGEAG